jgi:maleylpyruvate isomerase
MSRPTLYSYWRSSSAHRVRIVLALKGVDHEYIAVNLFEGEHRRESFQQRSPTGRVPCLVLEGESFVESVAIIELLEEKFPSPPIYPGDPVGRARVRTLVEIVNSATQPFQNNTLLAYLGQAGLDEAAQKAWLHHHLGKGLAAFERAMQDHARAGVTGPYAYGATTTAADAYLVPQVDSARRFGVDLGAYPRLVAAYDAAMALEAFQRAAPAKQPDAPKG